LLLILFIVALLPVVLVQIPAVQTAVVNKVTKSLSEKLDVDLKVESVSLSIFSNKVSLHGIYVEDPLKDTLLYVGRLRASLTQLPLFGRQLKVGHLELSDGIFSLVSDSVGVNITQVLSRIKKKTEVKDSTKASPFTMSTTSFTMKNFRYNMSLLGAETMETNPEGIIYKNMSVSGIYIEADRIDLKKDTISFRLKKLALNERSGFSLKGLSVDTGYVYFGNGIELKNLELEDDYSIVKMKHFSMAYNGKEEFKDFVNKVVLTGDFYDSEIAFKTIGFFAPVLGHIPLKAKVNGLVFGPVANIKSNNLHVESMQGTALDGRFSITGLPDIESTIIYADLHRLTTVRNDVITALSGITGKNFDAVNNTFSEINKLDFSGTFTGLVNDFVANGRLSGDFGSIGMDLLFKMYSDQSTSFTGSLAATELNLNTILKSDFFGMSDFNFMLDGRLQNNRATDISGEGVIFSLGMNGYNYENIKLSGRLKDKEFDGNIDSPDANVNFAFDGKINLDGTKDDPTPVFDFKAELKHVDLSKLNFNKRDSISQFSGKINANFKASGIFDYMGELSIVNGKYRDNIGDINLGNITLTSSNKAGKDTLSLKSDFVNVDYSGQDDLNGFISKLKDLFDRYLHVFNSDPSGTVAEQNNLYRLEVLIKKSRGVSRIFMPDLFIAENTKLNIDAGDSLKIKLVSDKISLGENYIDKLVFDGKTSGDSLLANLNADFAKIAGLGLQKLSATNSIHNKLLKSRIAFSDTAVRQSSGDVNISTRFADNDSVQFAEIDIHKSELKLFGDKWTVEPAKVIINRNNISLHDFNLHRRGQYLKASGTMSKSYKDTLRITLDKYRLAGLGYIFERAGYEVQGKVSGLAEITGVYDVPIFMSNLQADSIVVNHDTLGNITVGTYWNSELQRVELTARVYDDKLVKASINGFFVPKNLGLKIDSDINELNLFYLNPVLKGVLSGINGASSGKMFLRGTLKDPTLTGRLDLNNIGMTVDYLKSRFNVTAAIDIEKSKFVIRDGKIKDLNGNGGQLNITLEHNNFRDIKFDAVADVKNILCLNTREKDNPLFYGTAYATGRIRLSGTQNEFNFNIAAESNKNSILYIPLSDVSEASGMEFLSFKKKGHDELPVEAVNKNVSKSKISLQLDLDVTPESEIQILIDPKVGDIIKAKGSGHLTFNVVPAINLFTVVGDYVVESGDYNFTLPNFSIVSRKFTLNNGSRIKFNGDIAGATLDVTASYRERVQISSLLSNTNVRDSRHYPAVCKIQISGRMTRPSLKFDIDIQDLDPERKAQIQSYINTEEKMTKQFLALLVFKTFVPDQDINNVDLGSTALMSNATELLSAQIGSLISLFKLPVPIDFGLDYSTNSQNSSGSEFEFDLSTQLFDRVIINGSAGNNTTSNRDFVGNFETEILLGKQGNVRLKGFSKSRDYFSDDMDSNRNGVSISYQGMFERFIDLFRKKPKAKRQ
jgi:hypothetical protein